MKMSMTDVHLPATGRIWLIIPTIGLATLWLYFLTRVAPSINVVDQVDINFPKNFKDLKNLSQILQVYYKTNWAYVLVLFSSGYIYKQAFIIPGSVFLNVLGGALFGVKMGFPLCCFLTACGASCCYWLSRLLGKKILVEHFPDKIRYLQEKIESNSHQLVYYLLFLRMFPMTPNWLINLSSPIIGITFPMFFFTVFVGLMPYNFLCVQTGELLTSLTSLEDLFNLRTFAKLALLAFVALGPSFLLKKPAKAKTDLTRMTKIS